MKKIILYTTLIFISHQLVGQNNYNEKVQLNVDRTLYVAGENICFFAILQSNYELLSNVLYLELITPNGKQIVAYKFKANNNSCEGIIHIPHNIISGNYYLRAYTKYMRNYGPSQYDYQLLKIVNPYKSDLLNGHSIEDSTIYKLSNVDSNNNYYHIQLPKEIYQTRENVNVKIKLNQDLKDSIINTCISVIPAGTANFKKIIRKNNYSITKLSSVYFKPETRGITLSGKVQDKNTKELLHKIKVNLSILDTTANSFYSTITKENGQFFFSLPDLIGNKDIFISPQNLENKNPELLIDNDFCTEPIVLPNPTFYLTKEEQLSAYKQAINKKVENQFLKNTISIKKDQKEIDTLPFYGAPTSILRIDEYINLPTLEDYFNEIPFLVKIKKYNDKKYFKILGTQAELEIYDPLIMVDLISINQIQSILEISPKKIDRIEVVAAPYVLGDITYGGILNIISVDNDWAGIKLPESGIFLNYSFLEETNNYHLSDLPDNLPNTRNNLFWSSNNIITKDGKLEFSFKTADTISNYVILVVGIKKNGDKIYSTKKFKLQ